MEAPRTVPAHTSVHDVAELLLREHRDGVVVVDPNGHLAGVVTTMDLVFQEKRPRLPTLLVFLDAVIPLGGVARSRTELRKIAAIQVSELMTHPVVTVGPDAPIDEIATRMVEAHLSVLPVVVGDEILGVVTKPALLRVMHRIAAQR